MAKKVQVINVCEETPMTLKDYVELCRQNRVLDLQMKELKKKYDANKAILDSYIDKNCQTDSKGNRYFETTDVAGKPIILKREARKSISFDDEKAREFFEDMGVLDTVLIKKVVEEWNEDEIQSLIAQGEIDMDELQEITNTTVTYATKFVTKKDPVEE